jgi:hypothetical protein
MHTYGGDFTFEDATIDFSNMDSLLDYVNKN